MSAFRAFDFGGWQGVELRLLVPHYFDLGGVRELFFGGLPDGLGRGLARVTAVVADVGNGYLSCALDLLELEPRTALGAELQGQLDPPPRAFLTPS
jgi:hypothetical protein